MSDPVLVTKVCH